MITGKVIKFGRNIDTDQIIGAHHLNIATIGEMARYTFEHHENFRRLFSCGDIIVAAENFGCGSSREQAPAVLQERKVGAIIANSFARIFFRNAINLGIRLIECQETADINELDHLRVERENIVNLTTGKVYPIRPFPPVIEKLIDNRGVVELQLLENP